MPRMVSLEPIRSDKAVKKKLIANVISKGGRKQMLDTSGASTKNLLDSKRENRLKK